MRAAREASRLRPDEERHDGFVANTALCKRGLPLYTQAMDRPPPMRHHSLAATTGPTADRRSLARKASTLLTAASVASQEGRA